MRARLWMLGCLIVPAACAQHHDGSARDAGGRPAPDVRAARTPRVTRAELIERLRVPLSRSDDGLRWEPHGARGARRLDLRGRARHAAIARVGPDGRIRISCVDSLAGAERALAGAADAP